ncbi:DUF3278 domain-containing protein [Philodulcilactobacillus myokoensis]|uniref:DUF3278 domain-containing protein n=1 Tax=Philodulcilactobacillus myokoensis TaxID=2929573 RepID=UPI00257041D8|nr:DUF3278 domain-containing protein [Philodulcilactobacillus myokoensis]
MNNKKLSLYDLLTKRIYGIKQLDEYKRSKAEHASNLFLIFFWFIFPEELLIAFICGLIWPTVTLYVFISVNFILFYIWNLYVIHYLHKYKLDENDIDVKDSKKIKRRVVRKSILAGVWFFIIEFVVLNFVNSLMDHISFVNEVKQNFNWFSLISLIVISALLSITFMLISFSKTKKFKS